MPATNSAKVREGVCDRCGRQGTVRRKAMIYDLDTTAIDGPYEWHCDRCRKRLRLYGWIALALVLITLLLISLPLLTGNFGRP